MLTREDIRKVLEAHSRVINKFKAQNVEIEDLSPKVLFDNILGELQNEEKEASKNTNNNK